MPTKTKPKKQKQASTQGGLGGGTAWKSKIVGHDRVAPDQLVANPLNYRKHPQAQRDALRDAIAEVGFIRSVTVNKRTGNLIDGHERVWQALTSEQPFIDVEYVDLSEDEEKKALATMDPISEMAQVDGAVLDQLLRDVNTGSEALSAMLSELAEGAGILSGPTEVTEDEVPEAPAKPITKPGDLWLLGEHRLLCGDSTKAEDVKRLMGGACPMIMMADQPYGVKLDQSWRDKALGAKAMGPGNGRVVENDDRSDWTAAWELFTGDIAYVWHAGKFSDVCMASLRAAGFDVCQQIIWNKSIMVMGRSDYHFKHEPCWYAVRKGKTHRWTGDRKQTTVIDAKSPNHIMSGSDEVQTEHPTQKPVACHALIGNHDGDVYDPFCGSGTTIIAAEQLNRRCYAMEISPAYCDVAVKRWENLTGKKAERAK